MSAVKYKLKDDVLFQKVDDETVILEPETGFYFTLDSVGTFMVERLQDGLSTSEVVSAVLEHFDAEQQEVEADLAELIAEMKNNKLITER